MGLKYLLVCLILILGLGVASPTLAVSPSSILVDVSPNNPSPNSNVNISLRSYAANLDSVQITWFVNNVNSLNGVGKKSFSVTTGASGSTTTVRVKILLPDGEIEKTIILKPSTMVLLWQANDSYVPPFYKGKALPASDSEIKVVAIPEIKTSLGASTSSKNMTYFWQKDYNNQPNDSGYGKNSFLYKNSFLEKNNTISVEAVTGDQKNQAEAQIEISPVKPDIVFYKQDTSMGISWEQALQNNHQINSSEIIAAVPYFISPKEIRRPELVWNWFINDQMVEIESVRKNIIPLKVEGGASGISRLRLEIENNFNIFQKASKEINIQF